MGCELTTAELYFICNYFLYIILKIFSLREFVLPARHD